MSAAGFRLAAAMSIALALVTAAVVWHDQPWSTVLVIASVPWALFVILVLHGVWTEAGRG